MSELLNQNYVPFRGSKHNFPALPVAVSRSVKMFMLFFIVFFSHSLFAECTNTGNFAYSTAYPPMSFTCASRVGWWQNTTSNTYFMSPEYDIYSHKLLTGVVSSSSSMCVWSYKLYSTNPALGCSSSAVFDPKLCSCMSCPPDFTYSLSSQTCVPKNYTPYDDNPYECIKQGGIPTGSFQNPSGLPFWKTGFNIKWVKKCNGRQGAIDSTVPLIAGITGNISGNPDLLGVLLSKGVEKIKGIWSDLFSSGQPVPDDYLLSLPKYDPTTKTYEPDIKTNPIAKGADGVTPSSSPTIEVDPYNQFLREEYFPKNNLDPNGDPIIDMATVDRFNKTNEIFHDNGVDPVTYTFTPNTSNIWKSTKGVTSTEPVYDTMVMYADTGYTPKATYEAPTFRVAPPDSTFYPPVPVKITDIPVQTTVTDAMVAGKPVRTWENTRTYPDGSTSRESIIIDETAKKGVRTTTVISPNGSSSTTSETFDIPNYVPGSTDPLAYDIVKNSPVTSGTSSIKYGTTTGTPTIDPVTGYPITTPDPFANTGPLPTTAEGQDIINASMPSYNVPVVPEFTLYKVTDLEAGVNNFTDMFDNIRTQLSTFGTTYDSTINLLNGSYTPPSIPAGSCGDFMSFDVLNKHVDLCPPMATFTSKFAPLVTFLITLSGLILAVRIYLSGLKD